MSGFIYVTYIRATPEQVWAAPWTKPSPGLTDVVESMDLKKWGGPAPQCGPADTSSGARWLSTCGSMAWAASVSRLIAPWSPFCMRSTKPLP